MDSLHEKEIEEAATLYDVHHRTCSICGAGTVQMCPRGQELMSTLMLALNSACISDRLEDNPDAGQQEGHALLLIIEGWRKWGIHVLQCQQCAAFDRQRTERKAPLPEEFAALTPCGIGNALILNLIRALEKGL